MNQALNRAKYAASHNDVPIGAVVVRDGQIIARGENRVQKNANPTMHAEIVAINAACKKLGVKFLDGCDIYVTLEPCAMCATAISFARMRHIYFAATDAKGGAITTNSHIFDTDKHLWRPKIIQMPEYADASAKLLQDFFKQMRKKNIAE